MKRRRLPPARCRRALIYFLIQRPAHLGVKFARLVPFASRCTSDESSYRRRQASNYKNQRANQLRFNNSALCVRLLADTGAVQPNEWTHGRARHESEGKIVNIGVSPIIPECFNSQINQRVPHENPSLRRNDDSNFWASK